MHTFLIPKLKNDPSHIRLRPLLVRLGLAALLIAPCTLLQSDAAQAALITPDLDISGQVAFDSSFYLANGNLIIAGGFSKTIEGIQTSTFPGPNPLAGTLKNTGDGFGMFGSTAASYSSEFALGFDMGFDITNNSAKDYRIKFRIDYGNSVDANGPDAFVDSEFSVDDGMDEVFFSDLVSDTFFGDEVGGTLTGTFGDLLSESGTEYFNVVLNASDSISITSFWTMEGGVFDTGDATLDFSAMITVDDISVVPLPPTLYLFGTGLFGLAAARMRRKKAEKS